VLMRWITMLSVVAALAPAAQAKQVNRYKLLESRCSQATPHHCIHYAVFVKRLWGWQEAWMYRVAACESEMNPYAHNSSGASGLYQFLYSTWASTPYHWRWIYSAKWNSLAAAWMVQQGRTGEWVCG
jgi:soluble lytic murein transglycosylase-like protein